MCVCIAFYLRIKGAKYLHYSYIIGPTHPLVNIWYKGRERYGVYVCEIEKERERECVCIFLR